MSENTNNTGGYGGGMRLTGPVVGRGGRLVTLGGLRPAALGSTQEVSGLAQRAGTDTDWTYPTVSTSPVALLAQVVLPLLCFAFPPTHPAGVI